MMCHKVLHWFILIGVALYGHSLQCPYKVKGRPLVHVHKMQSSQAREPAAKRRTPANKRQAIKWVVQGVEKCLADQQLLSPPDRSSSRFRKNGDRIYTYKRREDASLVDALYLLVNAKNQRQVLDAGKRIEVLMRVSRGRGGFPTEVTERVIKTTASTGLTTLSLALLRQMISDDVFPSPMAYIAVMNALRKNGRVSQMEELLTELASSCRRHNQRLKAEKSAEGCEGIDIIAFNSFVAGLCDAAVKDIPYTLDVVETTDADTSFSHGNSTEETTASLKYLYKAINQLKGDIARKKFELQHDPDIYSYNAILSATAKCSRISPLPGVYQSIADACLRGMEQRGVKKDSFTYNAMIEINLEAEASGNKEAQSKVMRLIDAAISLIEIDRYTVNLALVPLLRSGRRHELMSLLRNFHKSNRHNSKMIASAFEAFLNTLVQNNEVDFARDVFDVFFLSPREQNRPLTRSTTQFESRWLDAEQVFNADIPKSPPTTRHFNILFGGYSKMYRQVGRDVSVPIAQNAYSLLNEMLRVGAPLDKFTVCALMAFPSSSKDVTLLWKRIELDLNSDLSPAAFRSIIAAYSKSSDPSSACWVFLGEMREACERRGMSVDSWNVMLGALANNAGNSTLLDPVHSAAAQRHKKDRAPGVDCVEQSHIFSLVHGKTSGDAALCILEAMRSRRSFVSGSETWSAPKPNSQTYCQVAKTQSASENARPDMAMTLFKWAREDNAHTDGRFLNALIRCYADDIDSALKAWKVCLASAAVGVPSNVKKANLGASYNGLMYVCGRAVRPDVALRLAYAMKKAGVEPNEIALNSYLSGKRAALNGNEGKRFLKSQFESLLTVECSKYTTKDKRRANDKRIRIILS